MFRRLVSIVLLMFTTATWSLPLQLIATLPVFAQIATDIGGEHVQVILLSDYSADPHYFNLTPKQLHQLFAADYIIGPVEIVQRLPINSEHLIDVSKAYNNSAISSKALNRLIHIAQDHEPHDHEHTHDAGCSCHHHTANNPLLSLTHEWLSFDAIELLAKLLTEAYIRADDAHRDFYEQRYLTMIQGLEDLKKIYLNKELKKKSIFYHNDCWILEQELHTDFGPALYACDESGLSPQLKQLLERQSSQYQALIIDRSIPLQSLERITRLIECPIIGIDTLGSPTPLSTIEWLDGILKVIYS